MSLGQGSKQRFFKQKPGDPFSLYRLVSWNSHNFSIKLHGGECKSYRSPLKLIGSFLVTAPIRQGRNNPPKQSLLDTTGNNRNNFHPKELIQCLQGLLLSVKDVLRQLGSWDPKKQARKTASQIADWKNHGNPWEESLHVTHLDSSVHPSDLQILWDQTLWAVSPNTALTLRTLKTTWEVSTCLSARHHLKNCHVLGDIWCCESMHSGPYACLRGFQWVRRFVGCLLAANDPLTEC